MRILLWLSCVFYLVSCQQNLPQKGELRIGVAQLPMSLDPRFATDAASHKIQQLMHRGLVKLDEHWKPQPDVARSWEHPSPLVWVFHLRHGIFFHDGSRLTANDVQITLETLLDKKNASPLRAGFAAIEHVQAINDDTLQIRLKKPDSSLLTRLSLGILPANYAKKKTNPHQTMGCGVFKLASWHGNHLILQRVMKIPESNIQRLHFLRVKEAVTRSLKLVRGEIDFMQNDLPAELLPYLKRQKQLRIATQASTTFSYIGMNFQDAILKDVRVRKALALAINRSRLKQALLSDLPILAETVLTPKHWASTKLALTPFNPQKAEILLDKAGFPRNSLGIRFHLTYRTSTSATRLRLASAIADMWRKVGVDVSVESMEWGGFYARIKRGDFQVFSLSWVSIADPDIYRWMLHSSMWPPKGANRGRYANKDVDTWLDEAQNSQTLVERQVLYAKIQYKMQQDVVYIPLWYEPVIAVFNQQLQGFKVTSDGGYMGLLHANLHALSNTP
ncbi:MAG: ABC transporter substrate-binding protein [Mariprofundaceae bacterium]|nr:ABC transporter substrate-binding protein [Mariprofundaceae bacterium]